MMTKDQYIDSLRGLHLNLYSFGKKVENVVDNPIVRPSVSYTHLTLPTNCTV